MTTRILKFLNYVKEFGYQFLKKIYNYFHPESKGVSLFEQSDRNTNTGYGSINGYGSGYGSEYQYNNQYQYQSIIQEENTPLRIKLVSRDRSNSNSTIEDDDNNRYQENLYIDNEEQVGAFV